MKEAQSLQLRQQFGGGKRWRSLLALFGMLGGLLVLAYFRIRHEVAPKHQPLVLAAVAALFLFFYFQQKRSRKQPDKPTRLEVSAQGIAILNDGLRVEIRWSGFSQCLESPGLFVLVDRPKTMLIALPKRAFPDVAAQDWFRSQVNQPSNGAASTADVPWGIVSGAAANGVALNYQLGYRDYLNRMATSWRTRGIALFVLVVFIGMFVYQSLRPMPNAVNSPAKVFAIMIAVMTPMMTAVFFVMTFVAWRSEIKYLEPRQVVLAAEHLAFAGADGQGTMPWTTYTHYLENRWSFFIWKPGARVWDMFPKRAFTSASEIDRCRELLQRHLKPSRWFYY